jgi:hypothetical protein
MIALAVYLPWRLGRQKAGLTLCPVFRILDGVQGSALAGCL